MFVPIRQLEVVGVLGLLVGCAPIKLSLLLETIKPYFTLSLDLCFVNDNVFGIGCFLGICLGGV